MINGKLNDFQLHQLAQVLADMAADDDFENSGFNSEDETDYEDE